MGNGFEPQLWHEAAVMIGGAAAALAGLLFVAASFHSDFLMGAPHWRLRVFGNTMGLIATIIEATLILIPQTGVALGWQVIVFNLFFLFSPARFLIHLIRHDTDIPIRRAIYAIAGYLAGLWGGISLVIEAGGGLYFVVASMLLGLWLMTQNAFLVMTMSHDSELEVRRG